MPKILYSIYIGGSNVLKIFGKAAVLVFIILSIYFIVNPSACSNLLAGRVVNTPRNEHPQIHPSMPPARGEVLAPAGDKPDTTGNVAPAAKVTDTNSMPPESFTIPIEEPEPAADAASTYTQDDIDYAVASRYVELEREYIKENKPLGKDVSREISYIVMDDFEMSPQEWESFLTRATASNLFNKVREEMQ